MHGFPTIPKCQMKSAILRKLITVNTCFLQLYVPYTLVPCLHYQPVSSRFSSCALTSPVSTSVCVYITTARTGLNQRQLVRLFHSTVAGSRAVPKHVRACLYGIIIGVTRQEWSRAREVVSDHSVSDSETMRFNLSISLTHVWMYWILMSARLIQFLITLQWYCRLQQVCV